MSHEHSTKEVYGRDQKHDRELDLPVPNFSRDHGMSMKPIRSPNDLERRRSQTPRNDKNENELNQSYQSNYKASVYNGFSATALASPSPSKPPDIALRHHTSHPVLSHQNLDDQLRKEVVIGQKVVPIKKIEDYKKKAALLRQELDTLKDQRNELHGDSRRSPSPDTKRFLKENTKLQLEVQNKLKTINNVLSMLNGIIGEQTLDLHEPEESPDRKRKSRSPSNQRFNYVYYDPEMHWCRACNEFPPTAKDYLNHLHSPVHQKMAAEHMEAPWHSVKGANEGFPSFPSAPTKRTPIRGLQFFVPATAWYCKLCDQFVGDLHCASAHIKSIVHSRNYSSFVEHNPHWETDWMSDRQKAFEKARAENKMKPVEDSTSCSVQYTSHTITISKELQKLSQKSPNYELDEMKKHKKKRKKNRSSSQSSVSEISENERFKEKRAKNKRLKMIEHSNNKESDGWISSSQDRLSDDDRKLLETLKSRMRSNKDERQRSTSRDRERIREMQRRIRESERRGRSSERRGESRERRGRRDPRHDRSDRRNDTRDRREDSRDRWGDSRDRRGESRERRGESRERRGESRDRRADSRDSLIDSRDQRHDNQAETQPPPPALPLPLPLPATLPLPTPLLPSTALPPPVIMPPPQSLLPTPGQPLPSVPKDFQEALEILFPTDPQKCTEMLNAMQQQQQQPSLLGMPPGMGMPFPPLGLMQPPGMFGFDPTGMFSQPPPPLLSMMSGAPRHNRVPRSSRTPDGPAPAPAPAPAPLPPNGDAVSHKQHELNELQMLGIDASDVGAGI